MDIDTVYRYREPFWVKSNPGEEFPSWHNEPCHMEVKWAFDLQLPKRNEGGVTSFAVACTVPLGNLQSGNDFRMHICRHTPCEAHWSEDKYGRKGQPLHVILA